MREPADTQLEMTSTQSAMDRYLRLIFGQIPGAIWATDRDLRLTYSQGSLAFLGLARDRVASMTIEELAGTADPTNIVVASHRAALSGAPQSFCTDDKGRWLEVRVEPLRADDGAIVGSVGVAVDTTEQHHTEQQLALSSRHLEEAQRFAHVGSFDWEIASDVVTWSDELYRIHGIDKGKRVSNSAAFLALIHPEDLARTKAAVFDSLHNPKPFATEHRIIRGDGKVRVLQTRGDVVTDEHGKAVRVVGSSWDATDLMEAQATRQRAVALVDATISATAEGVLVVDNAGKIVASNQRFFALWQIPSEIALQKNDAALLAFVTNELEDPDAFERGVRELYGSPARESFDILRFKDGRVFERNSIPQRVGADVVGRVWSFRDVTEREQRLKRAVFLADATRLLASLDVEAALDGVAHLAVPTIATTCAVDLVADGGPRRLLVVSHEITWPLDLDLRPAVLAGHATVFNSGAASCLSVPLVVKGTVMGAFTFVAPARTHYRPDDIELATELAQRAALSVENARLYRSAQAALAARDELLAVAAHEIRGPVASMHIAVQALARALPQQEPTMSRLLAIIQRDDRRLSRFVDELIDVGRIRSGQLRFEFEEVDLRAVVFEVAGRLATDIERSGSSLTINADTNVIGEWDPFRVDQIVTNLLSNAIKFGDRQPITVTVRANDGTAAIVVTDRGMGIASDKLAHIFEPFERAVSIRHFGGLGLGLHIVRVIVDGLRGTVHVESKPGSGSTFTVELPRSRSS